MVSCVHYFKGNQKHKKYLPAFYKAPLPCTDLGLRSNRDTVPFRDAIHSLLK